MPAQTKHLIVAIHITDRAHHVNEVQSLLTEYANRIKTRLGLHDVTDSFSSPSGLIILEMVDDITSRDQLLVKLNRIDGVECKEITFDH